MNLRQPLTLAFASFAALTIFACNGRTIDVGDEKPADASSSANTSQSATGSTNATDSSSDSSDPTAPYSPATTTLAAGLDCQNYPLPGLTPPPDTLLGTWVIDSFDDTSAGASPGDAVHYLVDRAHPARVVRFDGNGTWHSAECPDTQFGTCTASCSTPLQCKSGTFKYDGGVLDTSPTYLANWGTYEIFTSPAGIVMADADATFGWTNLVRIDTALPDPCN